MGLPELADDLGLRWSVGHSPPGTSPWNKIEPRRFCHLTPNWRGRPLTRSAAVVQLLGSTKTTTGLPIRAEPDENT